MAHRLRTTVAVLGAALLLLAALGPGQARGQQGAATVTVGGPSRVGASADSVRLNVQVRGAQDLAGFQFVLSFDSSLLQPVSVERTDFLSSTGREIVCADPTIESAAVRFTCVTLGMQPPGADGDGTLAVVTFKPLGHGATRLALSRVKLVHPDGGELPSQAVDGQLTVGGSGGAFPWWAAALIAVGVVGAATTGAVVWQRRRRSAVDAGGLGSDSA